MPNENDVMSKPTIEKSQNSVVPNGAVQFDVTPADTDKYTYKWKASAPPNPEEDLGTFVPAYGPTCTWTAPTETVGVVRITCEIDEIRSEKPETARRRRRATESPTAPASEETQTIETTVEVTPNALPLAYR